MHLILLATALFATLSFTAPSSDPVAAGKSAELWERFCPGGGPGHKCSFLNFCVSLFSAFLMREGANSIDGIVWDFLFTLWMGMPPRRTRIAMGCLLGTAVAVGSLWVAMFLIECWTLLPELDAGASHFGLLMDAKERLAV